MYERINKKIFYENIKDSKYIYYDSDNNFIKNSFQFLSTVSNTSCNNKKNIKNYACANLLKTNNITYRHVIFRTKYNIIQHSKNTYKVSNKVERMPNTTQKLEYENATTYAFGFKNVIITRYGTIHSKCWNISPKGSCLCNTVPQHIKYTDKNITVYKVVDISHQWGIYVFHSIVECLTKIGYYINELLEDESIKIHIPGLFIQKYLRFLGFKRHRFVGGTIFVRRLLSLERGSCGGAPSLLQVLSLRSFIRNKISTMKNITKKYDVVIIKRDGVRSIINHNELLHTLQNIFGRNSVVVFYANETLVNVLTYFTYAKLIVGPHGAGLSHIIISDYNAIVLEFLSIQGLNQCFSGLALKLGIKYYGLRYNTTEYRFFIDIEKLKPLLLEFKNIIYS